MRRVAILEEGQLVEIYIEREKEFASSAASYKGRVTPFYRHAVCIRGYRLDGDAFL